MVNVLFCGNEGVFDGMLTCTLSILMRTASAEPFNFFIFTMDLTGIDAKYTPLTDKQIDAYLKTYVPILDKDFVAVAVNDDDKPVGFLFCVPSLSKAVKKSKGRLFPFGFINILKALKKNDTLEALIMGVMPEYQQCGVPVLLFKYLHENCIKRDIDTIIMNPQLEENYKVQSLFGEYKTVPFMRRRAYRKTL